jgi:hypothetical protein
MMDWMLLLIVLVAIAPVGVMIWDVRRRRRKGADAVGSDSGLGGGDGGSD